jgi:hypothetical protein
VIYKVPVEMERLLIEERHKEQSDNLQELAYNQSQVWSHMQSEFPGSAILGLIVAACTALDAMLCMMHFPGSVENSGAQSENDFDKFSLM